MMKHELEALVKHGVTVEEFDVVEAWYMKRGWASKEDAAQVWRAMFLRDAKEREQARRVFYRKQNLELALNMGGEKWVRKFARQDWTKMRVNGEWFTVTPMFCPGEYEIYLGITNGLDGADPIFRATHYASSGMWGVEAA